MSLYERLTGPLLMRLDPETAHGLGIGALRLGLVPGGALPADPVLASDLWGLAFPNPIGLAAGFDKDALVLGALLRLGFGFVEAGTVTPLPQPGNPRPRLFRLMEDEAVINRMGFNNRGLDAFKRKLEQSRVAGRGVVGANIGKNKDSVDFLADYVAGVRALGGVADYLVINVSSPNTPGLRDLQDATHLRELFQAVVEARGGARPPILVKVAPDLTESQVEDIAGLVLQFGIDGIIATNTTTIRPRTLRSAHKGEEGGLSGRPLFEHATKLLGDFYRRTDGRVPLIGVGGVATGRQAYAKIRAGASLVQFYTAMVFRGPSLVRTIARELADLLRADGYANVSEAVGADHR